MPRRTSHSQNSVWSHTSDALRHGLVMGLGLKVHAKFVPGHCTQTLGVAEVPLLAAAPLQVVALKRV